ncbi:MAG: hypothetical protein ACOX6S_06605 [Clostridia bacterium]|jgi:hypothetical protein
MRIFFHLYNFIEFFLGFFIGSRLIGIKLKTRILILMTLVTQFVFTITYDFFASNPEVLGYRPLLTFLIAILAYMFIGKQKVLHSLLGVAIHLFIFIADDILMVPITNCILHVQSGPPMDNPIKYFLYGLFLRIPLIILSLLIHFKKLKIIDIQTMRK